jgi:hypothetical protein
MHLRKIILPILISLTTSLWAQNKATISGFVKDSLNGETMPGVTIINPANPAQGVVTNLYGFYSITLEKGNQSIRFTSVGYAMKEINIDLVADIKMDIDLTLTTYTGKEVVISGDRSDKNTRSSEMGTVSLSMDKIKSLPAFMGEVDLLKTIQLMPGVKSAGDGNTGFYVRGGGPDQNLILLDEAVIYNPSHLLGFFSVFNGDAVSGIQLYKGGMPAIYGGRLASVLDVSMKEGNARETRVEGGIGLISSRLTVQGPIKKDTASFIISARRTYVDIVATPFIPKKSPFKGSGIFFYDLNAKINWRLNDKNRLFLSGYFGRDKFSYKDKEADFEVNMPWGNSTSSFRWNHIFNRKLFLNTSLVFSDFKFEFGGKQSDFEFKLFSGIRDYNVKTDFNFYPNIRHNIKFGVNYTFHRFTPYNASASQGEVVFDTGKLTRLYAHELAGYASDDWDINDYIKLHAGIRYSFFQQVGPFDRYLRNGIGQRTDTVTYENFAPVVDYGGWEPRLMLRVNTGKNSSIKASYTRNLQYIHLASLSAVSLPTDVWVPSTELVQPQIGVQYALGFFKNFREDMFETSVEIYYKEMENQVEYKEGSLPEDNLNDNSDYNFTFGKGWSFGAEFFIKKRLGKFNGWIGYTWSKTERQFPELNSGKSFYARFDRRHDASLVLIYEMNDEWTFSGVFVYGTGNAITLPVARYFIEGRIVNEYGERNSFRMAPYHRLDLSATWHPDKIKSLARKTKRYLKKHPDASSLPPAKNKWEKFWRKTESSWNFSVFNVYNRMNPFFLYFDNAGDIEQGSLRVVAKQVSLFPVLPSVTYNFKF